MHHHPEDYEHLNIEHKSDTPVNIKDLWQTPSGLFNKLDMEFAFTCDVAASNKNHLCAEYLTEIENAIDSPWGDVNWCNPPYSDITPWINKAIIEHDAYNKTIVMLVPSDTSVKWFKLAYESCNEVRFISGRISFINAYTQLPVNGNNKGSVIFIWRGNSPKNSHTVTLIDRDDLI